MPTLSELAPDHIEPASNLSIAANPGTAAPDRQPSILSAWKAAEAKVGALDVEEDLVPSEESKIEAAPDDEAVETEAADDETEEEADEKPKVEAKPKEKERGKRGADGKFKSDKPADEKPVAGAKKERTPEESAELKALIADRRRLRERHDEDSKKLAAHYQGVESNLRAAAAKLAPLQQVAEALENGDFDGVAHGLGKFLGAEELKSWTDLNGEILRAMQAPGYKRIRELERKQAEIARANEQQIEAQRQQRAQYEQQQARAEWQKNLASDLADDEDPAIAALLDARPQMIDAVFNTQQSHYHTSRGELQPPSRAAETVLAAVIDDLKFWGDYVERHADSPVIQKLMGTSNPRKESKTEKSASVSRRKAAKYEGASSLTDESDESMSEAPVKSKVPAAKSKSPVANVSQSKTAAPSPARQLSEKELKDLTIRQMENEWRNSGLRAF